MSGAPAVNPEAFILRLEKLYTTWESTDEDNQWEGVDALAVVVGKDDVLYAKSTALQVWLFGYELADTLCVFCDNSISVLSSKKKVEFLRPLENALAARRDLPKIELFTRVKGEQDTENFKKIMETMKQSKSGKRVGVFVKDAFTGNFVDGWNEMLGSMKMSQVDVSAAFALASASKDETEIGFVKKACQITCTVFSKYLKKEIITIVDEEQKIKHSKLADNIEQVITEGKFLPAGVEPESVEICYSPIIQSGGNYQLKFSTVSSDERLNFGTILCFLGVRYRSYCANICRTMFVEPSQVMQDNYTVLLEVYEKVLDALRPGSKLCDVYTAALDFLEGKQPELKEHFTRNVGFATGLEFREALLGVSPKCVLSVAAGMVFNINLGFAGLSDGGKQYALFIGDTVLVNEDGPAIELTAASKKKISSIAIFLGDEENDDGPAIPEDRLDGVLGPRGNRIDVSEEVKRKGHQAELTHRMNNEARKRLLEGQQQTLAKRPRLSANMAYKHSSMLPRNADVQNHRVFVDRKYETVILPVLGMATPFHVSTVKNISKSEEGSYVYLRINLYHPGSSLGRAEGVVFPNADATFVKEVSLRASSKPGAGVGLVSTFNLIKEVQKKYRTREQEKKELEGYVEQSPLVLNTSRGNPRLKDLYMRPVIGSRRIQGTLEAHTNGLRYTTMKADRVDILYNNIKAAFFQTSKGEMIVLLHFHLKHPIIIGKKKHKDIQFYTEVGEIITDLGRAQHMHDRDDLMAEHAERELRGKLDGAFDTFRKRLEDLPQCHTHFEKPFRDLGFHGVPHRSTVLLQPTTNCLVNLSDQPPFIVIMDEVELVHFERVQFHMRNFDMVFVFKDYKTKAAMVTAIPMTQLDSIKSWLNSCDIKYTEGLQSLNWTKIMKTINEDTEGFFDQGGWSFLDPESDASGQGSGSDSEESEYNPSDASAGDGGEGGEEEEEESDEDYSSEESESSDFEEDDEESEEESGKDWDELEDEARRADKEQVEFNGDEEDSHRRRPTGGRQGGASSSKLRQGGASSSKLRQGGASPSKQRQGGASPSKQRHHGASPSKRRHGSGGGSKHHASPKKKQRRH